MPVETQTRREGMKSKSGQARLNDVHTYANSRQVVRFMTAYTFGDLTATMWDYRFKREL